MNQESRQSGMFDPIWFGVLTVIIAFLVILL